MGANQSGAKLAGQFEPDVIQRDGLQAPTKSPASRSNKNSFTKHQLSKLLRKGANNQQVATSKHRVDDDDDASKYLVSSQAYAKSDRSAATMDALRTPIDELELARAHQRHLNGYGANHAHQHQLLLAPQQTVRTTGLHQQQQQQQRRQQQVSRSTHHEPEQTSGNNFNVLRQQQREQEQRLMNMQARFDCSSTSAPSLESHKSPCWA